MRDLSSIVRDNVALSAVVKEIISEAKEITIKVDFHLEKSDKKEWKKLGIKSTDKNNIVKALTGTKAALIKYYTVVSGWRKSDVFNEFPELKNESSLRQFNENSSINDFKKALKVHDWWYAYSDDNSVYRKGAKASDAISKMFRELLKTDKEEAVNAYIATAKKNNDAATATMLKKEYL